MHRAAGAILFLLTAAIVCAAGERVCATGVPVSGFYPMVGIGLTDEFNDDFTPFPIATTSPSGGTLLGAGGVAHYDVALMDTGASVSVLTKQTFQAFGLNAASPGEPDGYNGTETITIGGATGTLEADVDDPLGLYAGGLQGRSGISPFVMNSSALKGQTNSSVITAPVESDLPNVLGLPYSSQYATYIHNDQPQLFSLNGKTVRSPAIEFFALGSGGHGISRRAPMSLNPGASFAPSAIGWVPNQENFDLDNPQENPQYPTLLQGGLFLNINAANSGSQLNNVQFFFDTGADVSVLSELTALQLGIDVGLDTPDFTIAVIGSGGTKQDVPGFYIDSLTIQAIGGSVTATNVPVVVLDVPDPGNTANIVTGIIGTSVLAGRNLVIDPNPSLGSGGASPSLYISDPVTTQDNWTTGAASGTWATGTNWSVAQPTTLSIANVRNVAASGNQEAVVNGVASAWELNVSGSAGKAMKVRVTSGAALTTFGGINVETFGTMQLEGGTVDAQFIEIQGGTLTGAGSIFTGSGPIAGQVENRGGVVAPGNGVGTLSIVGRFASDGTSTLSLEIGGLTAGTQYDQLIVNGAATLDGTLSVALVNGYTPAPAATFTVLTASEGLGGKFDVLAFPALPAGRSWFVGYGETALVLKVTLPGDFDGDFDVDGADLTVWKAGFGTTYTGQDFLVWQRNFGGSITPVAGVPEPGACVLAAIAVCSAGVVRRRGRG